MDDDQPEGFIEWVDEPPRRWAPRRKPIVDAVQEKTLRTHPGRWAKVRSFKSASGAHQARKRWRDGPGHLLRDEWEVEGRKLHDGTSVLFVRFVGPEGDRKWETFDSRSGSPVDDPEPEAPSVVDLVDNLERSIEHAKETRDRASDARETVHDAFSDPCGRDVVQSVDLPDPVTDDEETEAETDAAFEDQVGIINGVCGPCRRLRCYLCAVDDCACARPGHVEAKRKASR